MSNVNIYNIKGEKTGTIKLLPEIFDIKINTDLVHQVLVTQLSNKRQNIASTKDRGEVRGGGRKPWRQKGTGRARHGSSRSPIWVGGGVTFGPTKERVYSKKINKKMKRKALFMVLTSKVKDNEIKILDKLELNEPKTKLMENILDNLFKKDNKIKKNKPISVLVAIAKKDNNIILANRNITNTKTVIADSLSMLDLLSFKHFLLSEEAIKVIEKTYFKKNKK